MGAPANRNRHTALKFGTCLVLTFIATPTAGWAGMTNVDCNKGQTTGQALTKTDPGDTIRVTGTCREQVTITTDRLTLNGQGTAILDGGGASGDLSGLLTIDRARGAIVTGFTIQNGPSNGLALHAATSAVQDNALAGIEITDQSTAELTDFTTQRNWFGGITALNPGRDLHLLPSSPCVHLGASLPAMLSDHPVTVLTASQTRSEWKRLGQSS